MCLCEMTYKELKTNLRFNDVRQMLYRECKEKREKNNEHMFITRHTVLGRWHEIKLREWKQIQDDLELYGCECMMVNYSEKIGNEKIVFYDVI